MSPTPIAQGHNIQAYTYWDSPVPANLAGQNFSDPVIFNPTTFTLITTPNEAVLVDTPTVRSRAEPVADWIAEVIEGRKLSTIYITHGHGDHFFAAGVIQERFPDAVIRATQGTYEHMQEQLAPAFWDGLWVPTFPELQDSPKPNLTVEVLPKDHFTGDGQEFRAVEVVGGDTGSSTVLHVPSLDLVVGGDVVYGGCYQFLAENTTPELRQKWIDAVDQIAALHPKVIVPSHRLSTDGFGLDNLEATKEYIRTWAKLDAQTSTWQELEAAVIKAYPKRIGNYILRISELLVIPRPHTTAVLTGIMSTPSAFTNKDTFAAAIHAAFNCPDSDLEARILDLYTRQSLITVNENRMSWKDFVPYVKAIRARRTSVEIQCHHFIRDGNMFAERHTASGTGKDGTITKAEALLMGELNEEGKAIWVEEIAILSSDTSKTGEDR
ncbi:Metallo-hydrolase/oxidoreductase [Trichoderma citrinoviride]|uniref:Metallo-hydrolase/oxidoreductase n=1 Tax=Trichoderma citrinoviride TaxID=58853 RepID=A0A2T4BLH7_9HYPO|nr:Metallo-hydrolase/oxidoreductase [Trichoderma citrinoviride]PTB70163.1 Metallo-hydrolase/oxidoreductase [Trichoderma citrinoviride]